MKKEMMSKEVRHHDNSSGVTGMILGILSVISGIPGLLLGFVGFWFSLNQYKHGKNKWAIWGLALNIIGFILAAVFAYYLYITVGSAISGLQGAAA
ncbi:MAG: hypothetical protein AABW89_03705 [Nanoarchaeota archaeon]